MAGSEIVLAQDGQNAIKFTFTSRNGKITGRVAIGAGMPDPRRPEEKAEAARRKIRALAAEFAKVIGEEEPRQPSGVSA